MADNDAPSDTVNTAREVLEPLDRNHSSIAQLAATVDQLQTMILSYFTVARSDLDELHGLIERIQTFDQEHDDRLAQLGSSIHNFHNMLGDMAPEFEALFQQFSTLQTRIERHQGPMSDWQWARLILKRIHHLLDRSVHETEGDHLTIILNDIQQVMAVKSEIEALAPEISDQELRALMDELETANDCERLTLRIKELQDQYAEHQNERQTYLEKIEEYRWSGFITEPLEAVMKKDLVTIERVFEKFKHAYHQMTLLRDRLSKLDVRGFQSDLEMIYLKMADLSRIAEVKSDLRQLERKIEHQNGQ